MTKIYSTMNKRIIISERVKKNLDVTDKTGLPVIFSSDVRKEIESYIQERFAAKDPGPPLFLVLFATPEEFNDISRFLSVLTHRDLLYQFVVFGSETDTAIIDTEYLYNISEFRNGKLSSGEFEFVVRKATAVMDSLYAEKIQKDEYRMRLEDTRDDQEDLINIGKALSIEKDPERLLRLILFLSKRITGADAGSIYLVEQDNSGQKHLRFKYSHTYSRDIPLEEFVMDMNKKSISGYVAVTGEVLNIPDAYRLSGNVPYSFNSSFDLENDYISRSMLTVPMRNHIDEIIGVIQLINSKEDISRRDSEAGADFNEAFGIKLETKEDFDRYVVTFDDKYDGLLEAIAGQAAVAIENNRMIQQIQNQFEEFVKASVTAIESRDPATSGHSFRVAEVCKAMARAVNTEDDGYLKGFKFTENDIRELEFAALLHDFGKVYIDLAIFQKAKKLFPADYNNLILRLSYLYRYTELRYLDEEIKHLEGSIRESGPENNIEELVREKNEKLSRLVEVKQIISRMNEPTITEDDPEKVMDKVYSMLGCTECEDIEGCNFDIITDIDRINLTIRRGSLNPMEREEIESHVVHTYNFVSKIPWPPEYRNIPEIAMSHHEKIDGSGYPRGLKGRESTMIQSRIMAVADIYDALTASDRPYKKAVPLERVLKILQEEAESGKLDKDLVDVFIRHRIYEKVNRETFRAGGSGDAY